MGLCKPHEIQEVQEVLHLGRGNPKHRHRLGREHVENSSVEKDLGVLVDKKLSGSLCELNRTSVSLQPTKKPASWAVSKERWQHGEGRDCPPLLCSHEESSAVLSPSLGAPAEERCGAVRAGPEETTEMLRRLKHFTRKAEQVRLAQLGEEKALR